MNLTKERDTMGKLSIEKENATFNGVQIYKVFETCKNYTTLVGRVISDKKTEEEIIEDFENVEFLRQLAEDTRQQKNREYVQAGGTLGKYYEGAEIFTSQ